MTHPVDAYLAHRFDWRPVDATFMGAEGHDHRLPRTGPDAAAAESAELDELIAKVERATDLNPTNRVMLLGEMRVERASLSLRPRHRNPAWHSGEAAFAVASLLLPQSAPCDPAAVEARLAGLPAFLSDAAAAIRGHAVPSGWVARAQVECAAMARFLRGDLSLHEAWRDGWTAPAGAAAEAFDRFAAALADLPDADPACGADHLSLVMREQHAMRMSPAEAVEWAQGAFDRCGAEIDAMARAIDPDRSAAELIATLAADGPKDEAEAVARLERLDAQAMEAAAGLVTPARDYALTYRPFPDWARGLTGALYFLFYRSPPALDPGTGSTYFVARSGADPAAYRAAMNQSMLKAVHAVHHGSVGHHTQNARARSSASRLGRIAGTDCALGLAFLGAGTLIEGWACHVEDLMIEAGGFYSPVEILQLKSMERRNAASVLVDVNLHTGAWSLADCERFYATAGFAPARVRGEVVRNSMFPGSRLMYALGVEGIRRMRARWKGSTQAFHDRLLAEGHVPLAEVERLMAAEGRLAA